MKVFQSQLSKVNQKPSKPPNVPWTFTSLFLGVGEDLGNHRALRIEFSGSFKGIDGLRPLVTDGIETAQSEPQAPILRPPFQFSLHQDNGKAGGEVLAAVFEFLPPADQNRPLSPLPSPPPGCWRGNSWEVIGFDVAGRNLRLSAGSSSGDSYPVAPGCPAPPNGRLGRIG